MVSHLFPFFKHPGGRATGIIFALCGLIFGTWASLIPFIKGKFLLDEAELGILLLSMPFGTFVANPVAVFIMSRFGAIRTSLVSVVLMGLAFAIPVFASNIYLVSFGLMLSGATFATTNVAMNTCASNLEVKSGMRLMSACHGMWSIGAMSGALCSGPGITFLKYILAPWIDTSKIYMIVLASVVFGIAWVIKGDMRHVFENMFENQNRRVSGIAMFKPNRTLWILISIIICSYITEGTMADWSALYMKDITGAPEAMAGWGFAVYAGFMAGGRFIGDALIAKYGNVNILRAGGLFVLAGLIVIILSQSPWMALPGFMFTGLGISVASPILYAAASRTPEMPPGAGLATLNNFGMIAFLGGPVLIGFVAKALDLRMAFIFVALAALIWVGQTFVLSRKKISP